MANREKRVLGRIGARELTFQESEAVNGGARTLTVCTIQQNHKLDGDVSLGEC